MAMGHARRPARNWPMPKSYHRPACRHACQLRPQASARARGNFLKIGYFAPFIMCNFYTLRVEIFHVFFYPFTSTYDPYELWKVSWKSVCTFFRNPADRHTHRRSNFIYIDIGFVCVLFRFHTYVVCLLTSYICCCALAPSPLYYVGISVRACNIQWLVLICHLWIFWLADILSRSDWQNKDTTVYTGQYLNHCRRRVFINVSVF